MQQDKREIIYFEDVYLKNNDNQTIFKELSFSVYNNEIIFIIGHNDIERTLILYSILGLISHHSGVIKVFDNEIDTLDKVRLLRMRSRIGYVFPQKGLINNISIGENVSLPLWYNSILNDNEIEDKVVEVSRFLKIEKLLDQNSWEINNIDQKKVLFARSIINTPELLLIDEPTTYIEQKDVDQIKEIIKQIIKSKYLSYNASVIITTENIDFAFNLADKILCLKYGKIKYFKKKDKIKIIGE